MPQMRFTYFDIQYHCFGVANSQKGVRSMEVRGAQNIHSQDGTKNHPFVTPGHQWFEFMV